MYHFNWNEFQSNWVSQLVGIQQQYGTRTRTYLCTRVWKKLIHWLSVYVTHTHTHPVPSPYQCQWFAKKMRIKCRGNHLNYHIQSTVWLFRVQIRFLVDFTNFDPQTHKHYEKNANKYKTHACANTQIRTHTHNNFINDAIPITPYILVGI